MKIQYLIDVKKALQDIPDEVLDVIGWGVGEDSEEVGMCVWDEDFHEKWEYPFTYINKKYPQLDDISKWIKNLQEAHIIMETYEAKPEKIEPFYEMEEPFSSEDNLKKDKGGEKWKIKLMKELKK